MKLVSFRSSLRSITPSISPARALKQRRLRRSLPKRLLAEIILRKPRSRTRGKAPRKSRLLATLRSDHLDNLGRGVFQNHSNGLLP